MDPGGYAFTTNLTGAYIVASNACASTYEYPWVTENWQGSYSILATAYEGTEGITNALQTVFQAHYPPGGTPSTTTFIDSSGNPTNSYATNQTVCVQVQDPDMNQNPAAVETVSVVITTTSGDRETVTLTETGTNTGVFTGCITANTNAAVQGNGVLNAPGGAGLTATYTDPLNPSDTSSDSAIVRLPPGPKPVVSLFKTLVAPANSTVLLGSTVQFNIEVANPGSVTVTNVTLTDTFPSARLQFVSATIPPDSTTPAGTLTWNNLGPLSPGDQRHHQRLLHREDGRRADQFGLRHRHDQRRPGHRRGHQQRFGHRRHQDAGVPDPRAGLHQQQRCLPDRHYQCRREPHHQLPAARPVQLGLLPVPGRQRCRLPVPAAESCCGPACRRSPWAPAPTSTSPTR